MFLQRLSELIASKKITKKKMLSDLGINKNACVDWERRHNIPSGDILVKIADYFNVSVDYLLGRTDVQEMATVDECPTDVKEFPRSGADAFSISEAEYEIVLAYRKASADDRGIIDNIVGRYSAQEGQMLA